MSGNSSKFWQNLVILKFFYLDKTVKIYDWFQNNVIKVYAWHALHVQEKIFDT